MFSNLFLITQPVSGRARALPPSIFHSPRLALSVSLGLSLQAQSGEWGGQGEGTRHPIHSAPRLAGSVPATRRGGDK